MRRVFTVDEDRTLCRDDGFHVEVLDDNLFEIGIHSVDCSDYVTITKEDIKRTLQKRTAPNRMVSQAVKDNFSLDAGTQRRAISLILLLDANGKIAENPHLCLSIVNVVSNLSHQQFEALIVNECNGDPKAWESYGVRETLNTGEIIGTTLPQLKNDIISLHNVFCYHLGKKREYTLNGSDLVQELGVFLNRFIAQYLYKKYNDYALVFQRKRNLYTQFRSPLRKNLDIFVLKQLICAMNNDDRKEMCKNVCGLSEKDFMLFIERMKRKYLMH